MKIGRVRLPPALRVLVKTSKPLLRNATPALLFLYATLLETASLRLTTDAVPTVVSSISFRDVMSDIPGQFDRETLRRVVQAKRDCLGIMRQSMKRGRKIDRG